MKYVAVDIGSTHIKSAVLDPAKNLVSDVFILNSPSREPSDSDCVFEVRANYYADVVEHILETFCGSHPDIEGLLLSTQMHGFILEEQNREAVYVSWQDTRCLEEGPNGKSYLETLRKIIPPEKMRSFGVALKPSLGLCNLYAKLIMEGSLHRQKKLYTLGSYIIYKLTGNNICHLSNAAPIGFADIERGEWDSRLLGALGIENLELPQIAKNEFKPCGSFVLRGHRINVFPDYGDQQVSILGCFAQDSDAVINIATASQVSVFSQDYHVSAYECRPYFEGKMIYTISNMPAGRHINVIMEFFSDVFFSLSGRRPEPSDLWKVAENLAVSTEGLSIDSTFFPTEQRCAEGCISGINARNLRVKTILSALYTDMAQKYWENIQRMKDAAHISAIVCAGGVSWHHSPLLSLLRDITGKEVSLSAYPDESLAGLMRIAKCCSGHTSSLRETKALKGGIIWNKKNSIKQSIT